MPNIVLKVVGVSTVCVDDKVCTYGSKYGFEVSEDTLKTLRAFADNGYIELDVIDEAAPTPIKINEDNVKKLMELADEFGVGQDEIPEAVITEAPTEPIAEAALTENIVPPAKKAARKKQ